MKVPISLLTLIVLVTLLAAGCKTPMSSQKGVQGYQALEAGKSDEAITFFKEHLQAYPEDVKARYNLAIAYIRQKKFDDAFKELQKVIAQKPDYARAHYYLALVYNQKKLLKEEISEYQKTLSLSPSHYGAHLNLGHALLSNGDKKGALEQYLWVIEKNPRNEKVLFMLGILYSDLNNDKKAQSYFKQYLDVAPQGAFAKDATQKLSEIGKKPGTVDRP